MKEAEGFVLRPFFAEQGTGLRAQSSGHRAQGTEQHQDVTSLVPRRTSLQEVRSRKQKEE